MSLEAWNAVLNADLEDPAMKNVMLGMANHAAPDGTRCFPSVPRLTAYSNLGKSTVRRKLGEARKLGLIHLVRRASHHRPTEYALDLPKLIEMKHEIIVALEAEAPISGGDVTSRSERPEDGKADQASRSEHQTSRSEHQASRSGPLTVNNLNQPKEMASNSRGLSGSAQNSIRKAAAEYFAMATALKLPSARTEAEKREAGSLWWRPIREICKLGDWHAYKIEGLIDEALARLDGLTISDPNSILKTCRAIGAEIDSGEFKPQATKLGGGAEFLAWLREESADAGDV